jgi:proteasome lid subunit RPN8/RPN11
MISLEKRLKLTGVYITKGALEEIKEYAVISSEEAKIHLKRHAECYGYLITPKNERDRLVRGSFFAYDQDVDSAKFEIPATSVVRCSDEINKLGYKVLGVWHSHGSMPTGHSPVDDENLSSILNRISLSNCITYYTEANLLSERISTEIFDNKILVKEIEKKVGRILDIGFSIESYEQNQIKSLSIKRAKLKIPVQCGFAYSIVVNDHGGEPYAKMATRDWLPLLYETNGRSLIGFIDKQFETELHVLDVDEDIKVDREKIREDVRKKLKFLQGKKPNTQTEKNKSDQNEFH